MCPRAVLQEACQARCSSSGHSHCSAAVVPPQHSPLVESGQSQALTPRRGAAAAASAELRAPPGLRRRL